MACTFAERTVRITSVTHFTITLEAGISQLHSVIVIPITWMILIHYPGIQWVNVQVIVVTENSFFVHFSLRAVQVVLNFVRITREVLFCKLINIQHIFCSQQVGYGLELAWLSVACTDSGCDVEMTAHACVQSRVEWRFQQVTATFFQHVNSCSVTITNVVGISQVEVIPVDLCKAGLVSTPQLFVS